MSRPSVRARAHCSGVRRRTPLIACAAALLPLVVACGDDPVGPGEDGPAYDSLTVDASTGWALVALGAPATTVTAADPTTSDAWHIGFFATAVMLNGGAAGPGGVEAYCVCQNGDPSDADVMGMTAESELQEFLDVTAAAVPTAEEDWVSDELAPAIAGWYSYDFTTHVVSPAPENVWYVRSASGSAYAKLHVTDIQNAAMAHPGEVTFEFAVQQSSGAAFDPTETVTLDVSAGPAYLDLETATEVDASAEWDVMLDGWDVRVNGGVSGGGQAGAGLSGEAFADITDVSAAPAAAFAGDAFGGAFVAHEWNRYNLNGAHQIWPTYQVFLVRRGEDVFKVQLIGYYGPTGESRRITFRYAPVE